MRSTLPVLAMLALAACDRTKVAEFASAAGAARPTQLSMPIPRGGAQLIGSSLADLQFEATTDGALSLKREHGATLVRWWTDGCPFCEQSLPALDELRLEFEGRGLQVIAAYHNKSAVELTQHEIANAARERGYDGRIALDRDWKALNVAWPAELRSATSVTLLVDAQGTVRFTHPGPEFHRSTEAAHARCAADFADLERAIEFVLAEDANRSAER
jgi:hypothetical protein